MEKMKKKILIITSAVLLICIISMILFYGGESSNKAVANEAVLSAETWSGKPLKNGFYTDFDKYSLGGNDYYFEKDSYELQEVRNLYEQILDIMEYLADENAEFERNNGLSIYISEKNYTYGKLNKIFLSKSSLKSDDSLVVLIKAMYGEKINEGAARALARSIRKNVWHEEYMAENSMEEVKEFLLSQEKNMGILDLSVASFEEIYYNSEEVKIANDLVAYIYDDYLAKHEISELMDLIKYSNNMDLTFEKEYQVLIDEWLAENNIEVSYQAGELAVRIIKRYEKDSDIYPYLVTSENLNIEISKNYNHVIEKKEFKEDVFDLYQSMNEYDFAKYIGVKFEKNAEFILAYFKPYIDVDVNVATVKLLDKYDDKAAGEYDSMLHEIYLYKNTYSFAHEYTHYITMDYLYNESLKCWNEGIAEYMSNYVLSKYEFSSIYDSRFFEIENDKTFMNKIKPFINEKTPFTDIKICADEIIGLFKKILLSEDTSSISSDFFELGTFLDVFYTDDLHDMKKVYFDDGDGSDLSYAISAYFTKYLIENYGLDKFIEVYKKPDSFKRIYGEDFYSMYDKVKDNVKNHIFDKLGK